MPAALVTLAEIKTFLDVSGSGDDALLQSLLDAVEARLVADCGREDAPFAAAATGRVETHDGTGTTHLFLDYPIADVTEVLIGHDPDDPDETLDPDDRDELSWAAGAARLARADGGRFGCYGEPRHVRVTYNTQDDLPADAALAVKHEVARLYRQLGSEDATNERVGGYAADLATTPGPLWAAAVGAHRRCRF